MQTRSSPAIHTLHSLAKQVQIPGYSSLSKPILYKKLRDQFNFERLKRVDSRQNSSGKRKSSDSVDFVEEAHKRSRRISGKRLKPNLVMNTHDPIMLAPLKGKHIFKFVRSNGSKILFDIESLVDYLLATGDFTDPETRIPFTDSELRAIDKSAVQAGLKRDSVLTAKKSPHRYAELKFRRDALQGLERCAGEVVTDIQRMIEEQDPDEAEMRLVMREFPVFADLYRQMKEADPQYAKDAMAHYKLFLKGPPNRPTENDWGLLEVAMSFLRNCEAMDPSHPPPSNHYLY